MSARQLIFELGQRPALGMSDFLVAPNNRNALAWLDRWPDWPASALAIHGPAGCGKSHLAAVWRARTGAETLSCNDLPDMTFGAGARCIVVESGETGVAGDSGRERGLLHLYNHLKEEGGHLLFTARRPPARWQVGLPDLASRLAAIPAVAIGAPDDALIGAVLVKLFADRQLRVGHEVLAFMLTRMERSFDAARGLVESIDARALAGHRKITVPFVREVLRDDNITAEGG